MRIAIERQEDNMLILKDYSDIQDKSEISHVLTELELIKLDLLQLWEDMNEENQTTVTEEKEE